MTYQYLKAAILMDFQLITPKHLLIQGVITESQFSKIAVRWLKHFNLDEIAIQYWERGIWDTKLSYTSSGHGLATVGEFSWVYDWIDDFTPSQQEEIESLLSLIK